MPIAFNPETGDALVLFDNEWIKPEKIAQNDKGEIAYLLNNEWVMPGQEPKPKEVEPETSTMGAMGRGVMRGALPSAAGIVTGGAGAVHVRRTPPGPRPVRRAGGRRRGLCHGSREVRSGDLCETSEGQ